MDKMTNKKALMWCKENTPNMPKDVEEKLDSMITSLEKKSANRKPTKTQEQNNTLKDAIEEVLSTEGKTVSEIISLTPALSGMNTQKVTPLLYQMEKEGRAVKITDGKKSLFTAA